MLSQNQASLASYVQICGKWLPLEIAETADE